jgi:hypothetical protein
VVHLRYFSDVHSLVVQLGPPIYRDAEAAVFIVPGSELSPGFFGTLSADGQALYAYVPTDGELIVGANGGTADSRTQLLSVDGQTAGSLNNPVWLTRGYHTLRVSGSVGSSLALDMPFEPGLPVRKVLLGSSLTLQNAIVRQTITLLSVVTAWHADRALNGDYHLFVHLVNADGKTVAQYDQQPGAGSYPTSQWTANQDWTESDDLPLEHVPPGSYHVEVGWYSYPDLQRIPVYADSPGAPDGLIDLGDVNIGGVERF